MREGPRHRRCRHCRARRRRARHRRRGPRAALPGGGRPIRPGDAKQLLGSSQDEHAAAVHCYGTHSGSVASPRMRRAPPLRFAVEVGIQAVLPTRCDAASSTCWCCWCWVSIGPTTKFRKAKTGQDSRAVQKGGGSTLGLQALKSLRATLINRPRFSTAKAKTRQNDALKNRTYRTRAGRQASELNARARGAADQQKLAGAATAVFRSSDERTCCETRPECQASQLKITC